jgi:NAD-dependent SIR2 family protein deacetylase
MDSSQVSVQIREAVTRAAQTIAQADALLITAGAGMGVDSGLPDFRGNEGFWKAYPPLQELGISFAEMANPRWFKDDPHLAWGFYGHRLHLYRDTVPHQGFNILLEWGRQALRGCRVLTSNVDGQFQQAQFDAAHVLEVHGSFTTCNVAVRVPGNLGAEGIEVRLMRRVFARVLLCHSVPVAAKWHGPTS